MIYSNFFSNFDYKKLIDEVLDFIKNEAIQLVIGLVLLFLAFKIINFISKKIVKRMTAKNADKMAISVIKHVIRKGLKIICFIIFLEYVGVSTAGIGAVITSIGLAFGLAVEGALSNFAGGVILFIMRPFKIDDFIEAQGQKGTVEDIRIFYTYITTPDNRVVMIPNGTLANGTIINYSIKDLRRVDLTFGISYSNDFKKAFDVINELCVNNEMVLDEPAKPFIHVISHGSSSLDIVVRVWTTGANYWTVYFYLMEAVKERFDEEKIEIPYNQLDVHVSNV